MGAKKGQAEWQPLQKCLSQETREKLLGSLELKHIGEPPRLFIICLSDLPSFMVSEVKSVCGAVDNHWCLTARSSIESSLGVINRRVATCILYEECEATSLDNGAETDWKPVPDMGKYGECGTDRSDIMESE